MQDVIGDALERKGGDLGRLLEEGMLKLACSWREDVGHVKVEVRFRQGEHTETWLGTSKAQNVDSMAELY